MRRLSRARVPSIILTLSTLAACGDDATGPGAIEVVITPATATVDIGDTLALEATVRAADGTALDRSVIWRTRTPEVADVSGIGQVVPRVEGVATITAAADGVEDTAMVEVVRVPVAAIEVTPAELTVEPAAPTEFRATALDDEGNPLNKRPFLWESTDTTVALVSRDGIVTGLREGETGIRAIHRGTTGLAALTVTFELSAVRAGQVHTCGVSGSRTAYCWGRNFDGELGDGTTMERTRPVPVRGLTDARFVMSGFNFTCALDLQDRTFCWGANSVGQLGDGTTDASLEPVQVTSTLAFARLAIGNNHGCGITSGGLVQCWGANGVGQLGDGTTTNRPTPVEPSGQLDLAHVASGSSTTCALTTAGEAWCWGANSAGELGIGSFDGPSTCGGVAGDVPCALVPQRVAGDLSFSEIALGSAHTCGLTAAGEAYCWGDNSAGALGDGTDTDRAEPARVTGGLTFQSIAAGGTRSCGLTSAGRTFCWGGNFEGALGIGEIEGPEICGRATLPDCSTAPVEVAGGLAFETISLGIQHGCAEAADGIAYCWGANLAGEVGDGTVESRPAPVRVFGQ